jgi:hypothetical protein
MGGLYPEGVLMVSDRRVFRFFFQAFFVVPDSFLNRGPASFCFAIPGANADFSPQRFKRQVTLLNGVRDSSGFHISTNADLFKAIYQFFLGTQNNLSFISSNTPI